MVLEPVHCPKCDKIDVVKNGKSSPGKQRYLCRNQECCGRTFIQQYTYCGYLPEVKQQITQMAINSSGMKNPATMLKISRNTVTAILQKTSTATADQ